MQTLFDPEGQYARPFVSAARAVIDAATAESAGEFTFYLAGGATLDIDATDKVNSLLPLMVGLVRLATSPCQGRPRSASIMRLSISDRRPDRAGHFHRV